jgi:hypothetical protein
MFPFVYWPIGRPFRQPFSRRQSPRGPLPERKRVPPFWGSGTPSALPMPNAFSRVSARRENTGLCGNLYTNAPIVPYPGSEFNVPSEAESPKLCSLDSRQTNRGDTNHDHHTCRNSPLGSTRGFADVAAQPQLGILSKRRSGPGCSGPRDSTVARPHLGSPCG